MLKAGTASLDVWLTTDFYVMISMFITAFVLLYFAFKK